jgi:hypothetical protein
MTVNTKHTKYEIYRQQQVRPAVKKLDLFYNAKNVLILMYLYIQYDI